MLQSFVLLVCGYTSLKIPEQVIAHFQARAWDIIAFLILAANLILVKEASRRMVPNSAHACSTDDISKITANQQHSFSDRGVSRSGTSKKV